MCGNKKLKSTYGWEKYTRKKDHNVDSNCDHFVIKTATIRVKPEGLMQLFSSGIFAPTITIFFLRTKDLPGS